MATPDPRRNRNTAFAFGFCVALGVLGLACWNLALRRQLQSQTWRIGWEDDAPQQFLGPNGEPTGFAVELIREAARRRGITLQWSKQTESSEAALRSGAVDLWPIMTITPERAKFLHFSEPYVDSAVSLVLRGDTTVRSVHDVAGMTVGYLPLPINVRLAAQSLPGARMVPVATPRELIARLCDQSLGAVFIEQDELIRDLMVGGQGCPGPGFVTVVVPGASLHLAVGSTLRAAAAGEALREEINAMSADGALQNLFVRWSFVSGRSASYVEALRAAHQRVLWTEAAALLFGLLFLGASWTAWRSLRETRRARHAEAALRSNIAESRAMQDRLRLLAHALRSASECITITGPDDRLLYVNDAFLQTYEYSEAELLGQPLDILRCQSPGRAISIETAAALASGRWRGELWNRGKSGREFLISLATSQVRDDEGNFIAMVGVASDITAQRRAEQEHAALQARYLQAQKLDSIGRLAGGIAHDFNNLLTVINGYSGMLVQRSEGQSRKWAEQIVKAGETAASLTRQLLSFSRMEVSNPEPFHLNSLVGEALEMFSRLVDARILTTHHLQALPDDVVADPNQVRLCLMNLVLNARDAMPDGGELTISTSNVDVVEDHFSVGGGGKPGPYVRLTVRDSGIGIDAETLRHIFEPFFTTKEKGRGTGLGLSTVYGMVRQWQGLLQVESAPGKGSEFSLYLPLREQPANAPETPAAHSAAPGPDCSTLLIVEDQDIVRQFVSDSLKAKGFEVVSVCGGAAALNILEQQGDQISLMITDVMMPGMLGTELAVAARQRYPKLRVLFMTGYVEGSVGVNDYLDDGQEVILKPFTPDSLVNRVRDLLQARPEVVPG